MLLKDDHIIVSAYENKASREPTHVNLLKCLFTREFKDIIDNLRSCEYKSEEYDEIKLLKLPLWYPGIFYSGEDKTVKNIRISPIIVIDVDLGDNPCLEKFPLMEWKYELINQDDVICVEVSCGGRGLMVVHRLDDKVNKVNFVKYFNKLKKRYKERYNLNIDKSCNNCNRSRYFTYDEDILYNEVYHALEIGDEDNEEEIVESKYNNSNISFDISCREYDPEKSRGPFYFGHSSERTKIIDGVEVKIPFISSVINTLYCCGFSCEEICEIWKQPNFYEKKQDITANIRWTKNFEVIDDKGNKVPREKWKASKRTIDFLNNYCGFNISYDIKTNNVDLVSCIDDWIFGIVDVKTEIKLEDNEYMYDKVDEIIDACNHDKNILICPTGRGKTTFWNNLYNDRKNKICIIQPYKSIISSKYNNIQCKLCIENKKIKNTYDYVITHYNNFVDAYNKHDLGVYDYIVIDESHLMGMQDFRSDIILKFVDCIKNYLKENNKCKCILMTASPSNENYLFDNSINNVVDIKFKDNKFVYIQYMNMLINDKIKFYNDKNDYINDYKYNVISNILYLSKIAKNEGRKIYIYWGTGSIVNDEIYQEAAKLIHSLNIAIYHKRNEGNEDIEYIRKNSKIGKYDGMMSSCYFSVGCDLNDEDPAQIIIVGNNPYQEDYQVIGRFRKSKNIKVSILVNSLYIDKYDCGYELDREINRTRTINNARDSKLTSLIVKNTSDDNIIKKAYIKTSKKYFSDIERKFKFFERLGYFIVNSYNIEDGRYVLNEKTKDGEMPVIYIIDKNNDVVNRIKDDRKNLVKDLKCEIISNIRNDIDYELEDVYKNNDKYPTLQDWISGMMMLKNHYDFVRIMKLPTEVLMNVSKTKLNSLIRWRLKYDNNDRIENWIIEKLISVKEDIKNNELLMPVNYIMWCYAYDKKNDFNFTKYDLENKYGYCVYQQWKDHMMEILNVDDRLREIIMDGVNVKEDVDVYTKMFFDIDGNDEDKIEFIKNKYIGKKDIITFINNITGKTTNIKELINMEKIRLGDKSGAKKKCKVSGNMKKNIMNKYRLSENEEFNSLGELSERCNISAKQVSEWVKKGWILKM